MIKVFLFTAAGFDVAWQGTLVCLVIVKCFYCLISNRHSSFDLIQLRPCEIVGHVGLLLLLAGDHRPFAKCKQSTQPSYDIGASTSFARILYASERPRINY
ncbi:hypothetical protein M514_01367 [Trichuris suis]|uniref:Uncharacterized protein n=1 Tax=Trichuris suis TaxID=68888 RepID=A0A085NRX1_9BILA|nr:hypothetical protein M513_01367 [Trichuris suis]KFD72217.1 hypothetical protein M514_01367 [Trichuris suis]